MTDNMTNSYPPGFASAPRPGTGDVRLQAFIDAAQTNPLWAPAAALYYCIVDTKDAFPLDDKQINNINRNFQQVTAIIAGGGDPMTAGGLAQTRDYNAPLNNSQNAPELPDSLTFAGSNPSGFPGVRIADLPQFMANCDVVYQTLKDGGETPEAAAKIAYPIIDHSTVLPVAR